MIRKDLEKLFRVIQPQIIGILKTHDLVKCKTDKFSDIVLTQKAKSLIGQSDLLITDEWITKWKMQWPPGQRGTNDQLREKLVRFLLENDVTVKDIEEATKMYLSDKGEYCGKAQYFFYKLNKDRTEESRCLEYIELIQERSEEDNEINTFIYGIDNDEE